MSEPTTIAFVCVENAGRSQMAAAFATEWIEERGLQDRVEIVSGGTDPADHVHEVVIETMAERGIDLSGKEPRELPRESILEMDHVITMGCSADEVCPATWRGDSRDWDLEDPGGKSLQRVRDIRTEIEERVAGLLEDVLDGAEQSDRTDPVL